MELEGGRVGIFVILVDIAKSPSAQVMPVYENACFPALLLVECVSIFLDIWKSDR